MRKSTHRRKFSATVAGLVAAAIVGTGMAGSAAATDRGNEGTTPTAISMAAPQGVTAEGSRFMPQLAATGTVPTPAESGLDHVSDAEGIAAVERALDLIGSIPEPMIQRLETGDPDAVREVSDWLGRQQQASGAVVAFGWFGCAAGVAKFAAENGIGVAKAWKLIKNGKKVAKAVWAYVRHGRYPGKGIDDEIVNLIVNSTGLPDLAHACL
ncbi:hypothetical protein IPZ68_11395 [Streptomyces arenae]|nr:hypothetical protein [Streptomyces arenae]